MQKKGFTLVELLMVVIIIGILATIAVPQYIKATERSRASKARNALGQISKALKMYRAESRSGDYATLTSSAALMNLDTYVEMSEIIADNDWDYSITQIVSAAATTPRFTIRAIRQTGPNRTEYVGLTDEGTWLESFSP